MSFQAAYQAFVPRIREKCRRMLGDAGEAGDVAQETFVRLWQAGRLLQRFEQRVQPLRQGLAR